MTQARGAFEPKENTMRSVIVAALAAASAVAVIASSPAQARDYAYCLQGEDWGYPGHCQFVSRDECKAAASGTSADCGLNPSFAYGVGAASGAYARMAPDFGGDPDGRPQDRRGRW
jgi:hypothetical protein